ncbi:MAG: hypothetical protein OIN66_01070 [Candidatus Methanoperedens sp.]|nr:hypothetical protein [Candidatus Methanoperedens sp.]
MSQDGSASPTRARRQRYRTSTLMGKAHQGAMKRRTMFGEHVAPLLRVAIEYFKNA